MEEKYKFPASLVFLAGEGTNRTGRLDSFPFLRDIHILTNLEVKKTSRAKKWLDSNKDILEYI